MDRGRDVWVGRLTGWIEGGMSGWVGLLDG